MTFGKIVIVAALGVWTAHGAERIEPRMTFLYGSNKVDSVTVAKSVEMRDGVRCESFDLAGGLRVTTEISRHGDAVEWVNWFENRGTAKTPRLSQIKDCDIGFFLPPDPLPASRAFRADGLTTLVYTHNGSTSKEGDFAADVVSFHSSGFRTAALPQLQKWHSVRHYAPNDGRSSDGLLPFFNVNRGDDGLIVAVGWTGQWNCDMERADDGTLLVKTGLEDCDFSLLPGERIRTTSVLVMPYHDGYDAAQNAFRRLMREHYSPLASDMRHAPYSLMTWGGVTSSNLVDRIAFAGQKQLGFEYVWVDAGWYGRFTEPSPNEFEGTWWPETGDWRVNTLFHPDDLEEVSRAATESGMKFLLWVEIERAQPKSPVRQAHPDFMLGDLVDLGNPAAWEWAYRTLSDLFRRLNVRCYRQDFNMRPLDLWRKADAPDRKGMHEIGHIMGLYRLWDALRKEFPDLIIDNCASGGRRIDFETCRRSIPLWRSDYQCPANPDPEVTHNHTLGLARWIPYNGTSLGRIIGDDYRFRSAYSTAMACSFLFSWENQPSNYSDAEIDWLRKRGAEYKRFRETAEGDFYPLVDMLQKIDKCGWCAFQFDNDGKGSILAYRHEHSPFPVADFKLGGIDAQADYFVEDADDGSVRTVSGAELAKGFRIEILNRRESRLYFYTRKGR